MISCWHGIYESNQISQAVLCDGRTTRKVCYSYDEDGNLEKEYSPTDNSLTSYQYTVEARLEAVYTGNAYNRNLQMAAAYDGDGNRVYQVNYNPDMDEDFSCYYASYDNCDYNGTGIRLKVSGETSPTEEELIRLIAPAGAMLDSRYELIEYVNDVNREYVEVLVEQNINGRTDTTYTYGVDRISRELFNQTAKTSYYLYDPRGSVAGLADTRGHLTKTYQYTVTGELTHGSATYENEYTYNGESYNPNIHSQYLRARYYSVVTANFLTEDSYLGNIREPLTLNRYNYCISSYLNYEDPSGNFLLSPVIPSKLPSYGEFIDADITWDGVKEKASEIFGKIDSFMGTVNSFGSGVAGSLVKTALDKPAMWMYPIYSLEENLYNTIQQVLNPWPVDQYNRINLTGYLDGYLSMTESLVMRLAGDVEDMTAYYAGRCTGDVVVILAGMVEAVEGYGAAVAGGGTMIAETASGVGAGLVPGTAVLVLADALVAADGVVTVVQGMYGFANDQQRYQESKENTGNWGRGTFDSVEESLQYHFDKHGEEVGAKDIEQYIRKANGFRENLKGAKKTPLENGTPGSVRYTKNGKYIIIGPDEEILSYGLENK